jgi:hypothetical protein
MALTPVWGICWDCNQQHAKGDKCPNNPDNLSTHCGPYGNKLHPRLQKESCPQYAALQACKPGIGPRATKASMRLEIESPRANQVKPIAKFVNPSVISLASDE